MAFISNSGQATFKADLEAVFETLQEQRSSLLALVSERQLAARILALDELRRLEASSEPDDPRLALYADSSNAILRRVAALSVETQIADIRVPPVTQAETLLQGRVTDEADNATAHVQVSLVDEAGAPVAGVAPVETDGSGYYAFILQPAQLDVIGTRNLTIQLGSDNGRLVPAAAKPFTLTAGGVIVSEARLQSNELDKLNLRSAFANVLSTRAPVAVGAIVAVGVEGAVATGSAAPSRASAEPAPTPRAAPKTSPKKKP